MIESTHHSFINKDWLQLLSDELLNANGWVFDSKILHCGNPPIQPDFLRLSIVLHGIHT